MQYWPLWPVRDTCWGKSPSSSGYWTLYPVPEPHLQPRPHLQSDGGRGGEEMALYWADAFGYQASDVLTHETFQEKYLGRVKKYLPSANCWFWLDVFHWLILALLIYHTRGGNLVTWDQKHLECQIQRYLVILMFGVVVSLAAAGRVCERYWEQSARYTDRLP